MAIEVKLPDLYTIILKRRSTVDRYLTQENVRTKKDLKNLISNLKTRYTINKNFMELAESFLEQGEEPVIEEQNETRKLLEKVQEAEKNVDLDNQVEKNSNDGKKTSRNKRTKRRSNKKSPEAVQTQDKEDNSV